MSVVVKGVVDLPFINFSDTATLREIIFLLQENNILDLNGWIIEVKDGEILIKHSNRGWSWIKLTEKGVEYDKHFKDTEILKDKILDALNNYYPMFKKTLELIHKNDIKKYSITFNKEEEKILLEVYDE